MIHDQKSFAIAGAYGEAASDRIRRFLPMVRRLAWHLHASGRPGIELEDLMQAGMVALTECAMRHSGPSEDGFAAYAKMRVRGAMVDLIRRNTPMSRGAMERRRALHEARAALRQQLGREPFADELAAQMELSATGLAAMQAASEPLRLESIDEVYSDHDPHYADDRPDAFAILADRELRESAIAAIAELPQRLQLVIQLYFVEELNLSEIAEALQVSVPRVHQLKAQALERLRAAMGELTEII